MGKKRQLVVIMFTDIVGYTALMSSNEDNALKILHINRGFHKKYIERHGGKWLKEMGDGNFVQFNSALDSVNCAKDIQLAINQEYDFKLRIGIHLGDVTIEESDVFGDGVNIASRLQSIADPGGIYISESINEAIHAHPEIKTQYLADVELKNVDRLVRTYCIIEEYLPAPSKTKLKELGSTKGPIGLKSYVGVLLVILISILGWWVITNSNNDIKAIAVLPIVNMSGDTTKNILLAGIHLGIRDEIAKISALRVPSRRSSYKYQDSKMSIPEIANELKVDAIVETDLFETGDSIKLQVRLIKAFPEERQLWDYAFHKASKNMLSIYNDIALEIAQVAGISLTEKDIVSLSNVQEVNPRAYEDYLTGLGYLYQLTDRSITKALQYFELSIEKDPNYVLAYTSISNVWSFRVQQGFISYSEAAPHSEKALAKAIELDSTLIEVHYTLAISRAWGLWDWQNAEKEFLRTLELDPNHAEARAYYGHFLNIMHRSNEAIPQMDKALDLQPLNTTIQSFYGMHLNHTRQFDKAIQTLQKTLEEDPDNVTALSTLWTIYHNKGMYAQAIEVAGRWYSEKGEDIIVNIINDNNDDYKNTINNIAEAFILKADTAFVTPWQLATLFTRADNREKALDWLEKAYEAHDPNMPYISCDPIFDNLRNNPRFQKILELMHLPN